MFAEEADVDRAALGHALGSIGDVPGRVTLIEGALRRADPEHHADALWFAGDLMRSYRGSYSDLVTLIGGRVTAGEPLVRHAAVLALRNKFGLVAPAADALAEQVALIGLDGWNTADLRVRKDFREMVLALARLGDERVVPVVASALTQDIGARMLGGSLAKYRAHADRLVPTLRARLAAYAGVPSGLFGLLSAVRDLGAVDAVPEVLGVLDSAVRGQKRLVMEVALRTLASLGPGSAAAHDAAAEIAADSERWGGHVALRAVEACWSVHGEVDGLLPLLESRLRETDWFSDGAPAERTVVTVAAEVVGAIGPQAAPLADHLRTLMDSAEDDQTRVESAIALMRVTGSAAYAAGQGVLEEAWEALPENRIRIAECVRDLGPAAKSFHPILRAELDDPFRHVHAMEDTDSDEVGRDERLLVLCAEALGD
ncbi:MAG TPA: hypothetical protein VL551_19755 [Actinospica sp.]|jgi:hypothetical protein|nr:hypothetical protein [Actinospica sp.]